MASRLVLQWLAALADPAGPPSGRIPSRPLAVGELDGLCELADRHGVLPAVTANLRQIAAGRGAKSIVSGPSDQAQQAVAAARDMILRRAGTCLIIRAQASELRAAMTRAAVPAVVIKGVEFADRLYPRTDLRTYTDVDMLVPTNAVERADGVMRSLGYVPRVISMKHAGGYGEQSYTRPGRAGSVVEIHWNLVNSPSLRRGVSVTFDDLQRRDDGSLTPASLLLIAAVHAAASHGFDRLQPLCDVCQACRLAAGEIDVDWLAGAVRRCGASRAMSAALGLAGDVLAEPLCHELIARLALPPRSPAMRLLITPGVVLRSHAWRDSFRRCLFRVMLKRAR